LLIIILIIAILWKYYHLQTPKEKNISEYFGNKLYVGNLPYTATDEDLQQEFGQFGSVISAKVMMERDTGRSRGVGFVEMSSDGEAQAAIAGMNGQSLGGRSLVVNENTPIKPPPPPTPSSLSRGGYGGGGRGGRGGGGGGRGMGRDA
jgi:RNA recognition motif-containing protein